jgi:hypothetical protein
MACARISPPFISKKPHVITPTRHIPIILELQVLRPLRASFDFHQT